jgi:PAS domain-containing protein
VARNGHSLPGARSDGDGSTNPSRPPLSRPSQRPSISGQYSLAESTREVSAPVSENDRISSTQPVSSRRAGLNELRRLPLAAMTVTTDRRLIAANPSARRLLDLHLGFELDDHYLRCTEPDFAPRFAKLVSDAAHATQHRQQFHGAFELRRPDAEGWLDVVVAAHPEQGSAYALVVTRSRR